MSRISQKDRRTSRSLSDYPRSSTSKSFGNNGGTGNRSYQSSAMNGISRHYSMNGKPVSTASSSSSSLTTRSNNYPPPNSLVGAGLTQTYSRSSLSSAPPSTTAADVGGNQKGAPLYVRRPKSANSPILYVVNDRKSDMPLDWPATLSSGPLGPPRPRLMAGPFVRSASHQLVHNNAGQPVLIPTSAANGHVFSVPLLASNLNNVRPLVIHSSMRLGAPPPPPPLPPPPRSPPRLLTKVNGHNGYGH
jgi:hypothetical protein